MTSLADSISPDSPPEEDEDDYFKRVVISYEDTVPDVITQNIQSTIQLKYAY